MAGVLTTASVVTCGHSGTVSTSSSAKLKVSGNPVVLKVGVQGKSVSGCLTVTDPNTGALQCSLVATVSSGEAVKLKAGGQGVILDTLSGGTNGTVGGLVQNLLSATAGQSKLTAK